MRDAHPADPQAPTDQRMGAPRTDDDAARPARATRRRIVHWGAIAVSVAGAAVIGIITDTGADNVTADPDPPAVNLPSQSPASTATLPSTTPEPSPAPGRRVYWEDLQPGMCGSIDSDIEHFIVVACTAEHEEEVISRGTMPGSKEYPGDEAVFDAARSKCEPAFAAYVGVQWGDSHLDVDYLTAFDDTWKAGKVTLICLALDPNDYQLTRSLRGAHH
jgi:hypothetical protein